jgi:hypothetical protein
MQRCGLYGNWENGAKLCNLGFSWHLISALKKHFFMLFFSLIDIDLGYCNLTCFQTRGPLVQKWMFLLFVHGELIFHLILILWFWR